MHTGWNPLTQGRPPQHIIDKLKDYFIVQIKNYMEKGTSTSTVVKSNKPSSASTPMTRATKGWLKNQYGTWYKAENATFVNGNQPIITRIGSPFLNAPVGGQLPPGASINYDEVCLQAGHVWVGYYAYNGDRVYLPVRTWNGGNPTTNAYNVGYAWGSFR